MTLTRMIGLLVGALTLMLLVVMLRAETTRLHYEISELDRREDVLRQELRTEQLVLQRAQNPALLLERVKQMRLAEPGKDSKDSKEPKRSQPRTNKPNKP
jgi:hypothetical protein